MKQIKIFTDENFAVLNREINTWLVENREHIGDYTMCQSVTSGNRYSFSFIVISIMYDWIDQKST